MKRAAVALLLSSNDATQVWRAALTSQGVGGHGYRSGSGDALLALRSALKAHPVDAAIVDTPFFAASRCDTAREVAELRRSFPRTRVFLRMPGRVHVSPVEQKWAEAWGAEAVLGGTYLDAWPETVRAPLVRVLRSLGGVALDAASLENSLRALPPSAPEGTHGGRHFTDQRRLAHLGLDPREMLAVLRARGGIACADLAWRGTTYRDCFVASAAVELLESRMKLDRETAVAAGRALQGMGLIHHVVREQPFADDHLFFRFGAGDAVLDQIAFDDVVQAMRGAGGVPILDRRYRATVYPRCFIGSEAVDWLATRHGLGIGAAEDLGQRMLELGLLHHVVDEHPFSDSAYFYRFVRDER